VSKLEFNNVNQILSTTVNGALSSVVLFIPRFVTGLIVLLVGLVVASFLKQAVIQIFRIAKIDSFLQKYEVSESKSKDGVNWTNILAEITRWFVVVVFLVPTADIWGLGRFAEVLNGLIAYIPNVAVAVLLLLVGFVVAKFVHDLLIASIHGVSRDVAKTVAVVGRYSVLTFVVLVVLNQLGIASDLIRILFAGVVAMLAVAGGLAFGLGGRDAAKNLIDKLTKKV